MSGPRFRKWVLDTFAPVIRNLDFLDREREGTLTAHQIMRIAELVKPGDVLLSRTLGELTNYFIPGFYSHAAIMVQNQQIVEAVGDGVRQIPLGKFLMDKDFVGVFRYRFGAPARNVWAARVAETYVGHAKYDFEFEIGDDEFYCSELVWHAYKETYPNLKFTKREVFGVKTVLPDDFTCVRYWDNTISCIGRGPV